MKNINTDHLKAMDYYALLAVLFSMQALQVIN